MCLPLHDPNSRRSPETEVLSPCPPIPQTADFMDEYSLSSSPTPSSSPQMPGRLLDVTISGAAKDTSSHSVMGRAHIPMALFIHLDCEEAESFRLLAETPCETEASLKAMGLGAALTSHYSDLQ